MLLKVNVPTVLMGCTKMHEVKLNASNVNWVKISLIQNNSVALAILGNLGLLKASASAVPMGGTKTKEVKLNASNAKTEKCLLVQNKYVQRVTLVHTVKHGVYALIVQGKEP